MNILLIGGGGREHALAWKMSQSKLCDQMWAAPGNPGIAEHAECVDIDIMDNDAIVAFARENGVGLVVIGPEDPLANGLGDAVRKAGILCFGPSAQGARIEAEDTIDLVGPVEFVGLDVPDPVADVSNSLSLGKPGLAQPQSFFVTLADFRL